MKIKRTFFIIIILGIIFLILFEIIANKFVMPICETYAKNSINNILSSALSENLLNVVAYDDLVEIEQDAQGNVLLIKNNTLKMNQIIGAGSGIAEETLSKMEKMGMGIPIGYIIGSNLLNEYLPKIKFKFRQLSNVSTEFESTFEEAGINQTIHRIYLKLEAEVLLIFPGFSKEILVDSSIPLCETIIIGKVPNSYLKF